MEIDMDKAAALARELSDKAQRYAVPAWALDSALHNLRVANMRGNAAAIKYALFDAYEAMKNAEEAND